MKKKLIAGNWKMHGDVASAKSLIDGICEGLAGSHHEILVCPPYVHITLVLERSKNNVLVGAQDCSSAGQGAHTGDVSADMMKDLGCVYVILGHSERRQNHKEGDALVKAKAEKARVYGLKTIICVGETLEQREQDKANAIVAEQLKGSLDGGASPENCVIAYEPVWAIGTGKTASAQDILEMHLFIKETLAPIGDFRILYGGSVKPENAKEILSLDNVDGALIGGASLKVESFLGIAKAV